MFGYVIPYKPELKMREFDLYRSVYCGLCKQMGKKYTFLSRFLLSYDATFLAISALALSPKPREARRQVCAAHPTHKKWCITSCEELTFTCDAAMIMAYFSCKDHIHDHKFPLKYYFPLPFLSFACKKAKKRRPEIFDIFKRMTENQREVEKSDSSSVDNAADPTAEALSALATYLSESEKEKETLKRFGYMLGRYIYLMDALDDLQKDRKAGCYNPYIKKFPSLTDDEIQQKAQEMINLTIAQLASAYELLSIKRYKPLLDNIIYQGLPHCLQRVLLKKKDRKKQKELIYEQSIRNFGN